MLLKSINESNSSSFQKNSQISQIVSPWAQNPFFKLQFILTYACTSITISNLQPKFCCILLLIKYKVYTKWNLQMKHAQLAGAVEYIDYISAEE